MFLRVPRKGLGFVTLRYGMWVFCLVLVWFWFWFVCDAGRFAGVCAGIRFTLARFKRRPCAGRHLLFFAAVYRLETSLTGVQGHR
ncbi:hypothetical protein BCAR13_2080005 [Paraburkholderia caribensis]|nr:hypothetical protein BCAR13_2080005 [Paraburkholderia caribensis]